MEAQATIAFEQIKFLDRGDQVRGMFLGRYYFDLSKEDLERIGQLEVREGSLTFSGAEQFYAEKRFHVLLERGFTELFHISYNKPTIYIHQNSGIPLIGTNEFGIVDRGSNVIEIKPLTGCNFTCPYCSVDEGRNNKTHDYVVEAAYLVQEAAKVAKLKQHPVEFHIGPQGEPLLYPQFTELVRGLKEIPQCAVVTVVTNGSLLTRQRIDELAAAGLDKINLSLNAMTQETADQMAGTRYPLEHVLSMVRYCQGKINVILAPTIVPGWNDKEIPALVTLGKTLSSRYPPVSFQNFLTYQKGRNPVTPRSFEEFFAMLRPHESERMKLSGFTKEDFHIYDEPELPKPFKKRDIVRAKIVMPARYPNEIIAAAKGRCITVMGAAHLPIGRDVKLQIVRDKHNIFKAILP